MQGIIFTTDKMKNNNNTSSRSMTSIVASQSFQRHTIDRLLPLLRSTFFIMKFLKISRNILPIAYCAFASCLLASCSVSKQIAKQADRILLKDSAVSTGHIGISIYEPATGKYWYNYDATKYFVPASNTKLFSLYAGLKYLGDSIPALRYEVENDTSIRIQATGDPTFLLAEFPNQPVYNLLSRYKHISWENPQFTDNYLGMGWAWDDYTSSYMAERSNLPVYGNLFNIKKEGNQLRIIPASLAMVIPANTDITKGFDIQKNLEDNRLTITNGSNQRVSVPFTPHASDVMAMLRDTLHSTVVAGGTDTKKLKSLLRSQPVDSVFTPMMHRSDNFFAEQTLLMASNEFLGTMDDRRMIDTILNSDLKDIPQRPKWVDGSGLSRYNLFTPQSFVYILNKMKNEFGLQRLEKILPTGGTGTISSYYKKEAGFIFVKTGTLSNHCALSGFIITKKNKLLIFSVLNNHYITSATPIRKAVEKFLIGLREKY